LADAAGAQRLAAEPDWLRVRRERGLELATTLPLPTQKDKGWEFTDLSDLVVESFEPADAQGRSNGHLLASPGGAISPADGVEADGALVIPLESAIESRPELVEASFGSLVPAEDPFVARNEAAWRTGAFVHVPAHTRVEAPIAIPVVEAGPGRALAWRTLVVLEEGAEAEIWEQYLGPSDGDGDPGLLNSVVELVVGQGANLRYVCGQDVSERSWVFVTQRAELERDAALDWVALGFGSARGKVRMETKLAGRGSSARVTGAYAGGGEQHLDYDTTQEHAGEDTTSDLAFRGVLADRATAVWRGMIRVDRGAQRTDAFQENRNLLLSNRAHADAIPGLEIEADDVRCTHAAAVAQVDADQLYYLRTRGLDEPHAKRLVIDGFLQELVERAAEGPIRAALAGALERRMVELLD
jgi:Fe-S cluster assembly protein SufD